MDNIGAKDISPRFTSADKKRLVAWAFFDWANSAFPTVIITFVFATYFTQSIASNPIIGTTLWGYAIGISGIAVAILSPLLGAFADHTQTRKPWLIRFSLLTIFSTSLLWFAKPNEEFVLWALLFAALGNFGFEVGMVFYNSMLPEIAPKKLIGRISGWAWGLGYVGGLSCLLLALLGFVQTDEPWFGFSAHESENIRATTLLVAIWFFVFSCPLYIFINDKQTNKSKLRLGIKEAIYSVFSTLKSLKSNKQLFRFLIARMVYTDGLNTLFVFGGIYAAGTFGFTFAEIIQFGILINVSSGLGAAGFAFVDDFLGPKKTILFSLISLTLLSLVLLIIHSKELFWIFGLSLGIFIGPIQASSRSMMARMAPRKFRTELFGLYAFSGKATAFLGPFLLGLVTDIFLSQRAGMATILIFFVVGGTILFYVGDTHLSNRRLKNSNSNIKHLS